MGVSVKMSLAVVREDPSQADSCRRWGCPPQLCWASSLCRWGTMCLQSIQAKSHGTIIEALETPNALLCKFQQHNQHLPWHWYLY